MCRISIKVLKSESTLEIQYFDTEFPQISNQFEPSNINIFFSLVLHVLHNSVFSSGFSVYIVNLIKKNSISKPRIGYLFLTTYGSAWPIEIILEYFQLLTRIIQKYLITYL